MMVPFAAQFDALPVVLATQQQHSYCIVITVVARCGIMQCMESRYILPRFFLYCRTSSFVATARNIDQTLPCVRKCVKMVVDNLGIPTAETWGPKTAYS